MKRITIMLTSIAAAMVLFVGSAYASGNVGISIVAMDVSTSGHETVKSSGQINKKTHDETITIPEIFFELSPSDNFSVGLAFIPVEESIGSATNSRTDTDVDDSADTAGSNKVGADLSNHLTLYGKFDLGDQGAFFKAGIAHIDITTTENLATGTAYGNADVFGGVIGIGFQRELTDTFVRFEAQYSEYENISLTGTADVDGVKNKIAADIEGTALKFSIGKSF